jgi:hypothetical protein
MTSKDGGPSKVWQPVDYEAGDVRAIQALAGYAQLAVVAWDVEKMGAPPPPPSPSEVKRALDWIIETAAQTYENPAMAAFAAGDANVAWFVSGRASVGQAIVKLMKLKAGMIFAEADRGEPKDKA